MLAEKHAAETLSFEPQVQKLSLHAMQAVVQRQETKQTPRPRLIRDREKKPTDQELAVKSTHYSNSMVRVNDPECREEDSS